MKSTSKLLLLPLLAIIFLFQACNDDDDEMSREEMLVGAWTIQSNELTDYSITISGITLTKETAKNSPFAADAEQFEENLAALADDIFPPNTTITFNEDNTYVVSNQTSSAPEPWSLSSDEQELTIEIDDDEINMLVFDIQELTNNSLRVLLTLDENDLNLDTGNDDFEVDSFTIDYTFSFTK